jgi:1,4-dihydroxy-2-naphthoate octaprenyltransferase
MEQQNEKRVFKSLTPRDPEYLSYILGNFSQSERAIPQPSLNLQLKNEIVTFEIRPLHQLEPASWRKKLWLLVKPITWLTVLIPLLMIANISGDVDNSLVMVLGLSLILLMIFANWQADLADHLEGWDRLQSVDNKSVLQKGWFTGVQLQLWSKLALGITFLLAIPLLMKLPWVLVPYALAVLSLLLLLPRWWRKTIWPGLSSFCIFLLTGPLLTVGIDLAFDGHFTGNAVVLGMVWGLWMTFVRQQRIYSKQWYHYQKKAPYFFLGLGFDRSKALMRLLILVVPTAMVFASLFINGGSAWFFPLLVVHSTFVFWETQFNEKVQSSIGSPLVDLQRVFDWHHYAVSLVMLIGSIIWKTTFQ